MSSKSGYVESDQFDCIDLSFLAVSITLGLSMLIFGIGLAVGAGFRPYYLIAIGLLISSLASVALLLNVCRGDRA